MRLNKLRIRPLVLGLCLAPALAQADTLKEIYQQALQNDHQFKAAQANLAAGREAPVIGRAGLLPQVAGEAQLAKQELDVSGQPQISGRDATEKSYGVSLRQPLFDLAVWNQYRASQVQGDLAEIQFLADQQDLIIRTSQAYFDALKAVDNANTAKAEETALARQLEQTKQRFAVGLIAITDVHEAQAAYDAAVAAKLLAQGQVGIAVQAVEVLTGKAYTGLSPLQGKFPVTAPVPEARQEWVDFALKNNLQLKGAAGRAQVAEYNYKAKAAGHLPTVYGSLSYEKADSSGDGYSGPAAYHLDSDSTTKVAAISLKVPIFTGGYTSASRRQALQQRYAADEGKLQAERDIVQATRSFHLSVMTGVASVKARQQSIVSSQSALDATKAGYDVGTRDLVDLLRAQQNLFRAQRDYADALYSYVLGSLKLKQAAGMLSEKDVEALDNWLDKNALVKFDM
ncbi:MAG TPA: TolC family outer membrane protein [Cellvibrionaceae bacterium]|nr:TolC family outer membrane protein [Cellvibrionaceae bacterium]